MYSAPCETLASKTSCRAFASLPSRLSGRQTCFFLNRPARDENRIDSERMVVHLPITLASPMRAIFLTVIILSSMFAARADVAMLMLEPTNRMSRYTAAGHSAVYLSNGCQESPVKLQLCRPGEAAERLAFLSPLLMRNQARSTLDRLAFLVTVVCWPTLMCPRMSTSRCHTS
jgi:hypothetical protein